MKRIASTLLALALCLGLTVPAAAADFPDVPADHYARAAIADCAGKGIVSGYDDGTFKPGNPVTNAQFAVMLSRAFFPRSVYGPEENRPWYWMNLAVLHELGILQNTNMSDTSAWEGLAGKPISRYNMAQMLANILALSGVTVSDEAKIAAAGKLTDYITIVTTAHAPYGDAVATVCALGVITGYADGTFSGTVTMNRAQGCVVINRLTKVLEAAASQPEAPADPEPVPEEPADPEPAPEAPAAPTLANGQEITEENVRSIILALKSEYPEGRAWTNANTYSPSPYFIAAGCAGFAWICSDAAFGDLPVSDTHSDFSRIKAGDMIRMNNDTHSVVALEVSGDSVTVTEGNFNSSIHWGRVISRQELERGSFTVETRYPA